MSAADATADTTASGYAASNVSARAWVRAARASGIALPTLQADLRNQQQALDSSLTEAVRTEMPALLEISKSVSSTEGQLRTLCAQLEAHRSSAAEVAEGIGSRLQEFEAAFEERAALHQLSDQIRLLQRLAEALRNLEALLSAAPSPHIRDAAAMGASDDASAASAASAALEADALRLLRASSECSRLLLLKRRTAEMPAAQRVANRIDEARLALLGQLCAALEAVMRARVRPLASGDRAAADDAVPDSQARLVGALLWAFGEAEAEAELVQWVRSQWVAPRLVPKLQAAAADPAASLHSLAAVLLAFVEGPEFAPLARADAAAAAAAAAPAAAGGRALVSTSAVQNGGAALPPLAAMAPAHLVCAGPWTEWTSYLGESQAHLFGAGLPDTFQPACEPPSPPPPPPPT